jgi:hypothetical protein
MPNFRSPLPLADAPQLAYSIIPPHNQDLADQRPVLYGQSYQILL